MISDLTKRANLFIMQLGSAVISSRHEAHRGVRTCAAGAQNQPDSNAPELHNEVARDALTTILSPAWCSLVLRLSTNSVEKVDLVLLAHDDVLQQMLEGL